MKTFAKSMSWMCVSGGLFFCSNLISGVDLSTALIAVAWVSLMKTPFYTLHEMVWNWRTPSRVIV